MSITPTAIVRSASPRPYALAPFAGSLVMSTDQNVGWPCTGHMTTEHNPTATGSKRTDPGVLAGVLT